MTTPHNAARAKARRFALQALYQMEMTGATVAEVENQFRQDYDLKRVDTGFLHDLLAGIDAERETLTELVSARLDRAESELDAVTRAALLIGAFEVVHRIDVPFRVAINEGVELAKQFGGEDSHKLVNSVLDSLSVEFRQVEREARR